MVLRSGLIACLFSLALSVNIAAAGDFPKGTIKTEFEGDYWTIRFDGAGKYEVKRESETIAEGKYKATTDAVEFSGEKGRDDQVGKYTWKLDGKKLVFTLVDDANMGRKDALTTGKWTLQE